MKKLLLLPLLALGLTGCNKQETPQTAYIERYDNTNTTKLNLFRYKEGSTTATELICTPSSVKYIETYKDYVKYECNTSYATYYLIPWSRVSVILVEYA